MASKSARHWTASAPAAQTVLPDEILEEIFLLLDAAADLVRVSATCSSFRRIVFARRFLRRFRSLCSPAILGFISRAGYGHHEFIPVGPPHRSAPEARALVQAADFTFSFLPDPDAWRFRHAHDGRILLSRRIPGRVLLSRSISAEIALEDLLVCDPVHRRYVKIPRIPDDLVASTTRPGTPHFRPVLVLAPAGENDEEGSFRVICTVLFKDKAMAFVFSSSNQTWTGITSTISICLPDGFVEYTPYYAHGCFYWMVDCMGYSLILDTSEMKFSIIDLPAHNFDSMRAIVGAEEGRLGFLTIGDGTIDLYCKNWESNGVGAQEWQHDKLIPLPKNSGINYSWNIVGTVGRYLALLASRPHGICYKLQTNEYFVLDIKTSVLEKLCCASNGVVFCGFPYARFPPPFALPSI